MSGKSIPVVRVESGISGCDQIGEVIVFFVSLFLHAEIPDMIIATKAATINLVILFFILYLL